ncbi:MAG: CBS domain-containing protein [Bdellovibrionales bacterium]|nr:CBS domain-containing protein [Bdellovibrionales bacterium]
MTKTIPKIQRYMTTTPLTINVELNLLHAKKVMQDHHIRHLPVMEHGEVVGIISEKDIDFIQTFSGVDLKSELVKNAMTSDPYIVETNAQLDEVCQYMAKNKFGSVLVQDNKKLVGIFTWIDALNAMSELLHTRLGH